MYLLWRYWGLCTLVEIINQVICIICIIDGWRVGIVQPLSCVPSSFSLIDAEIGRQYRWDRGGCSDLRGLDRVILHALFFLNRLLAAL